MTEAIPELRDSTPQERPMRAHPQPAQPAIRPPAGQATLAQLDSKPTGVVAPAAQVEFTPETGKLAASKRWADRYDWEKADLDEALLELAKLRAELEKAGLTLDRRISYERRVESVECYNPECRKIIDVGRGGFAGMRTRKNWDTGRDETAYACSAACFLIMTRTFVHASPQK